MNTISKAATLAAACAVLSPLALAEMPPRYLAVDIFGVSHDDRIADTDLGVGGRIGVGHRLMKRARSSTGIELGLFHNPIESSGGSGEQTGALIDLMQVYTLGGLEPYVFAGIGGTSESVGPADGLYLSLEAGAGLMFHVLDGHHLRIGLSAMSVRDDDVDPDTDAYVDLRFNVGLLLGDGGAAAVAPAAPRVADSDGDGLGDDQDRCPTKAAATADGCPAPVARTDADADGVYDQDDACPGTLAGLKVDARGCALQTEQQSVVLKGVTFLPGSTTLTDEAKAVLDPAAAALKGQENLNVEIGGHTDAQGSDAANQRLSQRRADAVRQYLIDQGVAAGRLTAKGYGEAQPIASNDTPAGRAENRRVEFKVIR